MPADERNPKDTGECLPGGGRWAILGPLLLCLTIALLARLYALQETRLAGMTEENRWRQEARAEIERFRGGWTYALQVETAMDRLRRSVAAMLKEREPVSGASFVKLFRAALPASHRPEGSIVFAFNVSTAKTHELLSAPGLETAMGRLVGNVLVAALDSDSIPTVRRASLDRQSTGLFGELITLDVLGRLRRGKLTGARWRGTDSLMIWNAVETPNGKILWLALFPRRAVVSSRPVDAALRKGAARGRGRMWPVLVPLYPENGNVRLRVASGTVPAGLLRRLGTAVSECRTRNDIAYAGTLGKSIPGLWVMRDVVAKNLTYELWLVGPEPLQNSIPPWEKAVRAALLGVFCLIAARRKMNPAQGDLSLRVWFTGYAALVGILPLGLVWLLASWWITTNVERRVGEVEKSAEERLVYLDLMSNREVDRFAADCAKAMEKNGLLENLMRAPSGSPGQAVIDREFTALRAAGLSAEYMQVYRPGRDAFISTAPGANEQQNRGLFQLQNGLIILSLIYGDNANSERYINALLSKDRLTFEGVRSIFPPNFGGQYFDVRRRGHLFRGSDEPLFMMYEFVSDASGFQACLLFAARARRHFASLLRDELDRWSVMLPGVRLSWGMRMPGGFEPYGGTTMAPSPEMTRAMNDAARADTMQIRRKGERLYIARPCQRMPGFIAGMEFSTAGIRREAAGNMRILETILSVIVSILLLIGLGIGRHLLQPLARLEAGLRQAAAGDLDTRVGMERLDEIGEVTRAFDRMIDGLRERRELGRFVSGTLDQDVSGDRDSVGVPKEVDGAVLVSDLRSFTTISETYAVEDVVGMLNRHLDEMAGAINAAGGKIDRFIGDAVIAAFYGDTPAVNAERALKAAVAMVRAHRKCQEERRAGGVFTYGMGVGIDAGKLLVGSFGTAERMERAVLGTPRDSAERLEADSKKGRSTAIVLSDTMVLLLGNPPAVFEKIRGTDGWELIELPPEAAS